MEDLLDPLYYDTSVQAVGVAIPAEPSESRVPGVFPPKVINTGEVVQEKPLSIFGKVEQLHDINELADKL
jgi:hypothetical protein